MFFCKCVGMVEVREGRDREKASSWIPVDQFLFLNWGTGSCHQRTGDVFLYWTKKMKLAECLKLNGLKKNKIKKINWEKYHFFFNVI